MHIREMAIKKALQSSCRYKISALGFNRKAECIYKASNSPRFDHHRGGVHAEMKVMQKAGPGLAYIIICRANVSGDVLPIDPCEMCAEKARELGVRIYTIQEV